MTVSSLTYAIIFVSIIGVMIPLARIWRNIIRGSILFICVVPPVVHGDWLREPDSIAWLAGSNVVWRFCFSTNFGKPFFHPISPYGGPVLTCLRPQDHPWHYGLWFSWKFINKVNYWEEDRQTGRAEGRTYWTVPVVETWEDGRARITFEVKYVHPSGHEDLTERRLLDVSPPERDNGYVIDWVGEFTAGDKGALLDRTPMPGEPGGQVNGGYAGLSLRVAGAPFSIAFVCSTGVVDRFVHDRARPMAAALACNFAIGTNCVGSIAILSHPTNGFEHAPWYIVNSDVMRFICAAILAPSPRTLRSGDKLVLRYRIIVRVQPWTPEMLRQSYIEWLQGVEPSHKLKNISGVDIGTGLAVSRLQDASGYIQPQAALGKN